DVSRLLFFLCIRLSWCTTVFPSPTLFRSVPARVAIRWDPALQPWWRSCRAPPPPGSSRTELVPSLGSCFRRRRHAEGESIARLRSEEHTSELQSRENLVCRLLLEKKKNRP